MYNKSTLRKQFQSKVENIQTVPAIHLIDRSVKINTNLSM